MIVDVNSMSNEELMALYKKNNDIEIKQELTVRYAYIVKSIARQMRGVYMSFSEIDDMVNEGIIVLMEAIDNFDYTKNAKFETYASLRVRGSIIDVARKQDWAPRSIRKTVKEIDHTISELYDKLNRHPTDEEIAQYMGIPIEKYTKILGESSLCNILSLNAIMENSFQEGDIRPVGRGEYAQTPQTIMEKKEISETLKRAIDNLKPNEKLVISLYYNDEINIKDIAKILNLSESRISQIHSKALLKLKHSLASCEI